MSDNKGNKKPVNLVPDEKDRLQMTKLIYEATMLFVKGCKDMSFTVINNLKQPFMSMLGPAIKILKQISLLNFQQGSDANLEFDFRYYFLRDGGVKAVFEMGYSDPEW